MSTPMHEINWRLECINKRKIDRMEFEMSLFGYGKKSGDVEETKELTQEEEEKVKKILEKTFTERSNGRRHTSN